SITKPDFGHVATTFGSFVAGQWIWGKTFGALAARVLPARAGEASLWAAAKKIGPVAGRMFLERLAPKLAARFAAAAIIEGGALAVPVGGEVFDVALTIGLLAWTAFEIVNLAGVLFTSNE